MPWAAERRAKICCGASSKQARTASRIPDPTKSPGRLACDLGTAYRCGMTNRRFLRWALATIALLATALPGEARHRAAAAEADRFDHYLLSLSVAPAFCALSPANHARQQCQDLTEQAFEATPL